MGEKENKMFNTAYDVAMSHWGPNPRARGYHKYRLETAGFNNPLTDWGRGYNAALKLLLLQYED